MRSGPDSVERSTRDVIIRTLGAFPALTKSMLAAHAIPYDPEGWGDTLDLMVEEGIILREEAAPLGKTINIYRLNPSYGSTAVEADE